MDRALASRLSGFCVFVDSNPTSARSYFAFTKQKQEKFFQTPEYLTMVNCVC